MPLELISDEETVEVSEAVKTYTVIVDSEVVGIVTADADVTVTVPSEEVLFGTDTPGPEGPPGDPGIVASPTPPPAPTPGLMWVDFDVDAPPPGLSWPLGNVGATAATEAISSQVAGDAQKRFVLTSDGKIAWGSGAAVADTTLQRGASGGIAVSAVGDVIADFNSDTPAAGGTGGSRLQVQGFFAGRPRLVPLKSDGSAGEALILGVSGTNIQFNDSNLSMTPSGVNGAVWYSTYGYLHQIANAAGMFVVRGAAAQTADLQQWQYSDGGVASRITSAGDAHFQRVLTSLWRNPTDNNRIFGIDVATSSLIFGNAASARTLRVPAGNAASVALIVQGASGQTADLQQWQDSDGSARASVLAGGKITARDFQLISGTNAYYNDTQTSYFGYRAGTPNALLAAGAAAHVPLVVKGAAAQTASLQEWQNSTGAVLSKIKPDGNLTINGVDLISDSGNLRVVNAFSVRTRGVRPDTTEGLSVADQGGNPIMFVPQTGASVKFFGTTGAVTQRTGWGVATGTATRSTFDTTTVTTEQLAQRLKALIDDLHATAGYGLLAA